MESRQVLDDDRIGAYHRELKAELDKSGWRFLPSGLRFGDLAAEVERVRAIRMDFDAGQRRLEQWVEAADTVTDESRRQSVIFYREPDGERALRACHTHDVRLERTVA